MTKKEIIDAVAEKAQVSKKAAGAAVDALLDEVVAAVAKGEKVQFVGFGTFEARERGERVGQNPATGEKITIKASTVPAFKAGAKFKEAVAK